MQTTLKIGQLARHCGLTVRTLHHYDQIGLLSPSLRSANGTRHYGQADVIRLQQIVALKQLDCPLDDIRVLLDGGGLSLQQLLQRQIAAQQAQMERARRVRQRLQTLLDATHAGGAAPLADWLTLLEMMTMYDKHFSTQELAALRAHSHQASPALRDAWSALIEEVRGAMAGGMPPSDFEAQGLARRWMALLAETTGNDIGLALKLTTMQAEETRVQDINGITPAMVAWTGQAFSHARAQLFCAYLAPTELDLVRARMVTNAPAWPDLIARIHAARHQGLAFDAAPVQALAQQWETLFRASYAGGDMALEAKIMAAFRNEPGLMQGIGIDAGLIGYIQQAIMQRQHPMQAGGSDGAPKPSALMVANLRAAHQLLDTPPVFADPLALTILGAEQEAALRRDPGPYANPMSAALRCTLAVRSRLAEDEWQASGAAQYVMLGAGLDTYAYRASNAASHVRLFEVDLPAAQSWKRGLLRAAGIAEPANLQYVGVDFTGTTLADALTDAGFDAGQPAFFAWLGVTIYLDEADVLQTLRCIAGCAPGSAVVFDYGVAPGLLEPAEAAARAFIAAKTAERGEPWNSTFEPERLAALLHEIGFATVDNYSAAQLQQRYLAGRVDGLRLGGVTRLMRAVV